MGEPALMRMEGNAVFKMAVNTLDRIVDETLEANGLQKSDIDWLVPHQANIRIITATAKKLGMSMDNVVTTVAGMETHQPRRCRWRSTWRCAMAASSAVRLC